MASQWQGGDKFIKIKPGSRTGGVNNDKVKKKSKMRFLAVLERNLVAYMKEKGLRQMLKSEL